MKIFKKIYFLAACLIFVLGHAQEVKIERATRAYNSFSYLKTIDILLDVANKGYKSVDLFKKLGDSFYFNNKMEEAAQWYGELMKLEEPINSEYYFRYAIALKSLKNYAEADKWMLKFYESDQSDLRAKAFISNEDYLASIEANSKNLEVYNLDINSSVSDFGTEELDGKIIFASARGDGRKYNWNEQPFLDLYFAEKQNDGTFGNVKLFGEKINSKFHESSVTFSPDNKTIYFTRNNYFKNKFKRDDKGTNNLKIFRLSQEDNKFKKIESLVINSDDYSVAHPTINKAGTKLYFASDMPGTLGQSDLFVVDIKPDGSLGTPINLGNKVNTEGQETFPFINSKGDLYFSSNGFMGLGGLDIFVIRDFENKFESQKDLLVENIGKPINSSEDDFAYFENSDAGFFSSNRPGGKGDDDIYSFKIVECNQIVEGFVKDKQTLELIPEANVTLFDEEGNKISNTQTKADGSYVFDNLKCNTKYLIRAEKTRYSTDEKRFETSSGVEKLRVDFLLDKDENEITVGTDLAKTLQIPIIYFDFDKSNIRSDAEVELQKVIAVLKKYPKMKIDVRSHTDSRATFEYNDALSNRRNKSTIKYIIEVGGIDAERLTGKGYGERNLVNKCSDGVKCTEAEHQLNRRSEFIITSM
ncbi:OmpA family protein [Siansivirga zeaxanthinifaciens]|uniref:Flagellar motor protein MotB n=1 Tax=Siansivirga zeaxanthinifaciens CC-SAMT-1 TaxID=1454006 RepID=A0A0C5WAQ1_9FLAO|nr:OmpA family protein [Siansivirga zeaxanthinifaciens]AJR03397.1 flagellar motor protein MotB [Siansivirga zeaxanthinifaciens CC-SAMT-1]